MPKTTPISTARATAWMNTLRRAAGKNPWGNARWIAKYRDVPVISPSSSSSVNGGEVSKDLAHLGQVCQCRALSRWLPTDERTEQPISRSENRSRLCSRRRGKAVRALKCVMSSNVTATVVKTDVPTPADANERLVRTYARKVRSEAR